MAQVQRERHVRIRVAAGVAEHHALVARTLVLGLLAHHTLVDVRALLVNGAEHPAGISFEHVFAARVADAADHFPSDLLHVQVCVALHLAGKYHLPGGHQCFAGHFAFGIESEEVIDEGITDLIGDLVRMSFAYAFGGEEVWHALRLERMVVVERRRRAQRKGFARMNFPTNTFARQQTWNTRQQPPGSRERYLRVSSLNTSSKSRSER